MPVSRAAPARGSRAQVSRERVLARLHEADDWSLALIVAGAGFGKSVLLDHYAARVRRVARCDVQPPSAGLLDVLRSLARRLAPLDALGAAALTAALPAGALTMGQSQALPIIAAARKIMEQVASRRPCTLILDDYQWAADDADMQRLIMALVQPPIPGLRLILSTRSDPRLPVSRLRILGQVVELGQADLAFTPAEADQLLDLPDLSETARAHLHEVTEGWAAGLRLIHTYLSGLHGEERERSSLELGGDRTVIYDYLREEVLTSQPAARQRFLLESSLLPTLAPGECDAILGREDSEAQLRYLREHGLFLVPLAGRQGRYRYHHLFGAFLRDQAQQRLSVSYRQRIFSRAAAHYMHQGKTVERLEMLARGTCWDDLAGALVESHASLLERGEVEPLRRALEALPPGVRASSPRLFQCAGRLSYAVGDLPGAATALRRAADLGQTAGDLMVVREAWVELGHILEQQGSYGEAADAYRASNESVPDGAPYAPAMAGLAALAQYDGRWEEALSLHERALGLTRADEPARQASLMHNLAWCYHDWGRLALAREWYERSLRIKESHHLTQGLAITLSNLGLLELQAGHHRPARHYLDRAIATASRLMQQHRLSYALANLGELEETEGDLDAAQSLYRRSLAIKERAGDSYGTAYTLTQLARLAGRQGDAAAGWRFLDQARVLRGGAARPRERATFDLTEAQLALSLGDLERARTSLEQVVDLYTTLDARYTLVTARWMLAHVEQRANPSRSPVTDLTGGPVDGESYTSLVERLQAQFPLTALAPSPVTQPRAEEVRGLRVALLGRFELQVGNRPVPETRWKRRRARALLVALVLAAPRGLERDEVVEMLWPEAAPDTSETLFYAHLRVLRVALEPELQRGSASTYVRGTGTRYMIELQEPWDGALLLAEERAGQQAAARGDDDEALRHWRAAYQLYRGPLLPESSFAGDGWLVATRESIRQAALEAAGGLAAVYERRGQHAAAQEAWRGALDIDSCDERAHGGLIRGLAGEGRLDAALAQYATCVQILRRELDTAPSAWLTDLARSLRGT